MDAVLFVPFIIFALLLPIPIFWLLRKFEVKDIASSRSAHEGEALRGFGLAPIITYSFGFLLGVYAYPSFFVQILPLGVSCVGFGLLGAAEDFKGLPIWLRICAQSIISICGVIAWLVLSDFHFSPITLFVPVTLVASIAFIYLVNVANFMDGADGISAFFAIAVGISFALLGLTTDSQGLLLLAVIFAISFTGFLLINLGERGRFLGDSGSYFLGAGSASLSLLAVANGVPLYVSFSLFGLIFLDTAITLARRIIQRKNWMLAHREHVYQKLIHSGVSHLMVAALIGLISLSIFMVAYTIWVGYLWPAAGIAVVAVLCLTYFRLPILITRFQR